MEPKQNEQLQAAAIRNLALSVKRHAELCRSNLEVFESSPRTRLSKDDYELILRVCAEAAEALETSLGNHNHILSKEVFEQDLEDAWVEIAVENEVFLAEHPKFDPKSTAVVPEGLQIMDNQSFTETIDDEFSAYRDKMLGFWFECAQEQSNGKGRGR